jgi:hypothetical protein
VFHPGKQERRFKARFWFTFRQPKIHHDASKIVGYSDLLRNALVVFGRSRNLIQAGRKQSPIVAVLRGANGMREACYPNSRPGYGFVIFVRDEPLYTTVNLEITSIFFYFFTTFS